MYICSVFQALIPAIRPLFRGAVALAGIADAAGEDDVGDDVRATLFDGNDMIDGEIIGGVRHAAVGAEAMLSGTLGGEFVGGDVAAVALDAGTAAVGGGAMDVGTGGAVGAAVLAEGLNVGSVVGASVLAMGLSVGGIVSCTTGFTVAIEAILFAFIF